MEGRGGNASAPWERLLYCPATIPSFFAHGVVPDTGHCAREADVEVGMPFAVEFKPVPSDVFVKHALVLQR